MALVQVAKVGRNGGAGARLPDPVEGSDLSSVTGEREGRIRTEIRRDLRGPGLINANLSRPQGGIRRFEFVSDLLPRQGLLSVAALRDDHKEKQARPHML